jgi:uncharacterized membrane protein (DUF4010 family)
VIVEAEWPLFEKLGISLMLGLLVGLQREHAEARLAGMRTFPLISVLGTVAALLADRYGGLVLALGLLGTAGVLAVPTLLQLRDKTPDPGATTAMAALVMYAVGALLVIAPLGVGIAVGGAVAVLLQFKPELHGFARRLGDEDLRAIMQFVLLTCIILPVLPNQTYDRWHVLNPFVTWLFVVLIVGINLGGYIIYKFLGPGAGILLGGILGGAISSTATTVSYARQARNQPQLACAASVVVMIASAVVFVRVIVLSTMGSADFFTLAAIPFAIMAVVSLAPALIAWSWVRRDPAELAGQRNPAQLRSALMFGAIYVIVLLAVAATKDAVAEWGNQPLYLTAALAGLTDVDAITLSTAHLSLDDPTMAAEGWRLVMVANLSNLVSKAILAGLLGNRRLMARVGLFFLAPLAAGILLLLYY